MLQVPVFLAAAESLGAALAEDPLAMTDCSFFGGMVMMCKLRDLGFFFLLDLLGEKQSTILGRSKSRSRREPGLEISDPAPVFCLEFITVSDVEIFKGSKNVLLYGHLVWARGLAMSCVFSNEDSNPNITFFDGRLLSCQCKLMPHGSHSVRPTQ